MKRFWFLIVCLPLIAAAPQTQLELGWEYPIEDRADVTFHIYGTNDLAIPVAQWPLISSVPGPATNVIVSFAQGRFFFVCTASNMWGESPPSEVLRIPSPAAVPSNLTGRKVTP